MNTFTLNPKTHYYVNVPQSSTKPENTTETPSNDVNIKSDKNRNSANLLTAALSGLTVFGVALTVKNNGSNKKLIKQTNTLQQQIKNEYLAAYNSLVEEFNRDKLPEQFKKICKITNSKDFNTIKSVYEESFADLSKKKSEISKKIKNQLALLSSDKEWKELRALRKQLLKDIDGKNTDKQELAERKIPLINDLLVIKLHPEQEQIFQKRNLTTADNIRQLLKKEFAKASDFDEELQKQIKFDFEYNDMEKFFHNNNKLSLSNLFKEEYPAYSKLSQNISLKKVAINEEISAVQKLWLEKLSNLAADFQQKENVKKFKELMTRK